MISSSCKICNRNNLEVILSFQKYPRSISMLFKNKLEAINNISAISFVECQNCRHVQISKDIPQSFYEDYVMTVSHSPKMNLFQYKQAEFFVQKLNLKGKKVLEVGCGDGNFSMILKNLGCKVFCNEPSKPFRELALKKGLDVDDQFISNQYTNINAPFNAIVSREVLEHVPDPINFLCNIRKQLSSEGHLLIEVPNFEKTIQNLRYYDMFPDHLSYFSKESLSAALLISGYKDVEIHYGMDDEFIYAFARNNSKNLRSFSNAIDKINNSFRNLSKLYKHIVVWGAGGKGIATLGSVQNLTNIQYVVDSDPYKQGKYIPSSGLFIESPNKLFSDQNVDLLIITNLAYTDEISAILKSKNFNKSVKILSKEGLEDLLIY